MSDIFTEISEIIKKLFLNVILLMKKDIFF